MQSASFNYDFGLRDSHVREDGDRLLISGYASNWNLDREGDVMARQAFDKSLKRYMDTNPIVLYQHRYLMPMGRTLDARVDDHGLFVTVELPRPEPGTEAMNVWKLVHAGVIKAFSVGCRKATRKLVNGVKTVTDWDLSEISIAPAGVNPTTLFSLTSQTAKAFGDADDLGSLRADVAGIRSAAAAARREDAHRAVVAQRRLDRRMQLWQRAAHV